MERGYYYLTIPGWIEVRVSYPSDTLVAYALRIGTSLIILMLRPRCWSQYGVGVLLMSLQGGSLWSLPLSPRSHYRLLLVTVIEGHSL